MFVVYRMRVLCHKKLSQKMSQINNDDVVNAEGQDNLAFGCIQTVNMGKN